MSIDENIVSIGENIMSIDENIVSIDKNIVSIDDINDFSMTYIASVGRRIPSTDIFIIFFDNNGSILSNA